MPSHPAPYTVQHSGSSHATAPPRPGYLARSMHDMLVRYVSGALHICVWYCLLPLRTAGEGTPRRNSCPSATHERPSPKSLLDRNGMQLINSSQLILQPSKGSSCLRIPVVAAGETTGRSGSGSGAGSPPTQPQRLRIAVSQVPTNNTPTCCKFRPGHVPPKDYLIHSLPTDISLLSCFQEQCELSDAPRQQPTPAAGCCRWRPLQPLAAGQLLPPPPAA